MIIAKKEIFELYDYKAQTVVATAEMDEQEQYVRNNAIRKAWQGPGGAPTTWRLQVAPADCANCGAINKYKCLCPTP